MENANIPALYDFSAENVMVVKALLCDPAAGVCGVGVKEIGFGVSPAGKHRVIVRDAYMLQFITDGGGTFCGKTFGRGSVLFSVPNEPEVRVTAKDERYSCAWISFSGGGALQLVADSGIANAGTAVNTVFTCKRCDEAAAYLISAAKNSYGKRHGLELLSVLFRVLSMLDENRRNRTEISYVEAARRYMKENSRLPVRISDIAKAVSLSQNYLCKLFVRECGHSVKRELIGIRLSNACDFLKNTELTIRDVAYAVGFSDEKHFSYVFRKIIGKTPSGYRTEQRNTAAVPEKSPQK